MLILEDTGALLALMKEEEDPQLKREMLQMLVMMGSEDVDDELFELLLDMPPRTLVKHLIGGLT